ncbi:hypothetical protein [Candidatus Lariskella endosymbiont of Epinotia ramella]
MLLCSCLRHNSKKLEDLSWPASNYDTPKVQQKKWQKPYGFC